jgi:hypothetical protein
LTAYAGPNKINQEVGLLIQVLKRAEVWSSVMEEAYEPLQYEAGEIPRALSPEEQEHLLSFASSQERWRVIYCYALVVLNTTSSSYEMRGLRLGDVCRGLVKPWNEGREDAGLPWFQINALRHTALTRYAEAGTPIEIMRAYAGHISEKMTRHYIQIGEMSKRRYAMLAAQTKLAPAKLVQPWAQPL